jgi:hypothetical protein
VQRARDALLTLTVGILLVVMLTGQVHIPVGQVPADAVLFVAASSCPQGYAEYTPLRGRYPVGLPAGGTAQAQVGTALANLENRPAGAHTHTVTSGDDTPGTTLTAVNVAPPSRLHTTSDGGLVAGTNAPYIQLIGCRKT